jgi:hypothetical protein
MSVAGFGKLSELMTPGKPKAQEVIIQEPKEGAKLEELQQSLDVLEKQYSEKRKEQTEKHFWLMIGITVASFVLAFLTIFYFSSSNPFSLPTVNQNIFASQSTQDVTIDGFQLALVLSIAVAIIPLIVFSASRSRAIRRQNDELAALSLDIQRLRNRVLTRRQEEDHKERSEQVEEQSQSASIVSEPVPRSDRIKEGNLDEEVEETARQLRELREFKQAHEQPHAEVTQVIVGATKEWSEKMDKMLNILRAGDIGRFNEMRRQEATGSLLYLKYVDLSGTDLSDANLSNADLSHAVLSNAVLSNANLIKADLSDANLSNADLSHADLSHADLSHAVLSNANLSGTDLSGTDLSGTDLSGANLYSSKMIGVKYDVNYLKCTDADFKDAIIDDERLSIQLTEGKAKNVSPGVKSKKELREKLEKQGVQRFYIWEALSLSNLPE